MLGVLHTSLLLFGSIMPILEILKKTLKFRVVMSKDYKCNQGELRQVNSSRLQPTLIS